MDTDWGAGEEGMYRGMGMAGGEVNGREKETYVILLTINK